MAKVTIDTGELRAALETASVAVDIKEPRANLRHVHVAIGDSAVFTATDGHRLAHYDAPIIGKADAGECLLPGEVLRDMLKACRVKGSATLHFETGTGGHDGQAVFPKGKEKKISPVQRAKDALATAKATGRGVIIKGDDAEPEYWDHGEKFVSIAEHKASKEDKGAHVIKWQTPEVTFPKFAPIVKGARKGTNQAEVDRAAIINAVKIADVFEKNSNFGPVHAATLAFNHGTIRVETERFRTGEGTQVDVTATLSGTGEVGFNTRYLLEAFKAIPADTIHFQMGGPLNPVIIHGGDVDRQFIIQMPLRVEFSALSNWEEKEVDATAEPVKPVIVLPADTLAKDCPPDWDCDECGQPMWMHKAKIPFPSGGNLMECPDPVEVVETPPVEVVADPEPEIAPAYRAEHWQAKGLAVYGSPLAPAAEALATALPKASIQERGNALILSRKHEAKVQTVLKKLNRAA